MTAKVPHLPKKRDAARTQRRLLEAATAIFSLKGLKGARIDEIARRARTNKQLVYHYFGGKEALYLRALELAYERYRARDAELQLEALEPREALSRLVASSFDGLAEDLSIASLIADENRHHARHIRHSERLKSLHADLVKRIGRLLRRGEKEGVFRKGIDPMELYISVAALGAFFVTNNHTLSAVYGQDFSTRAALARRRAHVVDLVLAAVEKKA
jgi:TetR/AcrR family transcriptional regulator